MTKFYNFAGQISRQFLPKLSIVFLFLMAVATGVKAQVSVTATAGTPGPTPYLTLKAAFDAINAGTHQGAVTISIVGNTVEAATAVLNSSSVPSSYTSVSIRPSGAGRTITGSIGSAIIKLYGADNVTIDGFVGAGPARDLTISNSNASTGSACVWVGSASSSDGASNNIVRNCIITGNAPTTTLAGIVQSSGTTMGSLAEAPNSSNLYTNNAVSQGQYGIATVGGNTNDVNTTISNNTITNLSYRGIFISQQTNILVSKNTVTGVISTVGSFTTQSSGIFVGGTISGGLIEKNIISNIKINTIWGCAGILLNSSGTTTNLVVANNFIYDIASGGWFDSDTIDDNGFGIAVNTGGGYKIYYNSINMATNEANAANYNPPTAAFWISSPALISPAPIGLDVRDNIFSNVETTGQRFSAYSNAPRTVFSNINFNDYYSSGSVGFLGTNRVTLASWQAATLQDAASVAVNPLFTSPTNLHVLGNSPVDALATPIGGITSDIDDDIRNASTPDIGADEFTPPNCAGSLGGTATASVTDICASGSAILSSTGYSFGVGITYTWQYSTVSATGPWISLGSSNPLTASTGTISTNHWYQLMVTCSFTGTTGYSNVVAITVNNPALTSTIPGNRCGVGTVSLGATAPVGSTFTWYAAASGGAPLGTGSPFITPVISTSTNFYVSVSAGGVNASGGRPSTTGADGGYNGTDAGLIFDASTPFKIISVKMYPQAAGSIQIQALTSAGVVIATSPVITFAAAAPAGIVVPLSFNIPAGISHRLVLSSNPSSITFWRDFSGLAFPYALGTVGSITNGWLGIGTSAYYYFYDWQVTTACESLRTAVLATVNTPPAVNIAPSSSPVICSGSSVTLTASSADAGYVYTWNPGGLSGPVQTFTPAATVTYVLTADDGTCRNDKNITITVNQTPTALTITPTAASACPNNALTVTTSGALIPNQPIFNEDAETFPLTKFTLSQNGTPPSNVVLNQNTLYFQQGLSSIHLTHGDLSDGYLTSINIPLTGFANPKLTYYQIAGLEATSTNHYDTVEVQYSLNGGTTWITFPASTYLGAGTLSNAGYVSFDNTSYPDWDAQFSGQASTPGTAPATSLWKLETVDLSTWGVGGAVGGPAGSANFKIRYHLKSDFSLIYYGFLLDNINIKGTGHAPTTWSPIANLYHDLAHTLPITSTTDTATTVYYWVSVNTAAVTYTATASGGGTCNVTGTTTLSATSAPPSVTVSVNPPLTSTICSGQPVTFTATPVNGGAVAAYQWKINGGNVGASVVGQTTFTVPNALHLAPLANGETVTVSMSIPSGSNTCFPAGGTFASTNTITMTVNPTPASTVITGAATVCNGSLTALTETPGSGTITTWQWYLNGSPISASPTTYNATLPGSYTVTIGTASGCKDTSAPKLLTLPTYTITATAGANGTINPNGTVVVNCGSNVTFTITPNAGYSIQDVVVDGVSVGAVGTYTFNNVIANGHTINATFYIFGCLTPVSASAGSNSTICSNSNYTLAGSITGGATTGSWSTSGTGTFSPSNSYPGATTYIPSAADKAAGTVKLAVTSVAPALPCLASTDTITLTIKPAPAVSVTGVIGLCSVSSTTTLTADTSATGVNISGIQWYKGATLLGTTGTQLVNTTGSYSVTVTAVNGCTSSDAVTINILTAPTVTISGAGPICTGASIDINATATAGSGTVDPNGYKWYIGGVLIPAAVTATLSANLPGSYQATTTNSNGCVSALSNTINLVADTGPLSGIYTIGAGPASCTNYVTFATAINDLNTRSINGNCTFIVGGGYTEIVPSGGLKLGSALLNAATASGFTIAFQRSGAGANPLLTAYTGGTGTPSSSTPAPDVIWSLNGVDNVTITQIDLTENASNGSASTAMEFGYALFKTSGTDGAQNNTIQNCTITLSNANSVAGTFADGSTGIGLINATLAAATTSITVTSAGGGSSFNKFYGNTIINCHGGIVLSGFAATSPFTLADRFNDIGGAAVTTGNKIFNYGNSGDASAASGIRIVNESSSNVSYNTIMNNNGSGSNTTNDLRGIRADLSTTAGITITGNTITLTSAAPGGQQVLGIDNGNGSGSGTVLISDNIITATTTTALTSPMLGIQNIATAATVNIFNNTVQNCSLTGTGTFTGISNSVVATNMIIGSNTIKNNTKMSTGVMTLIAAGNPTSATISSNILSGNVITGGAAAVTFNGITGATSNYTVDGNDLSNNGVTGMSGSSIATVYGYYNNSGPLQETIQNNKIHKLYVTGTSTGLQIIRGVYNNTSNGATHFRIITRNTIDSLYTSAAMSGAITGIYSFVGFNVSISKNKISRLFPGQSITLGSFARGVNIQSGTTVKVFNNIISLDLTQTPSNNSLLKDATSVSGIEVTSLASAASVANLYFNTIRLAGAGSGTSFGTSGISISAAAGSVDIRDNIVVNSMNAGGAGAGVSAALRKIGAATYALTSNNNNWYTTETATTPLYYTGATFATLAVFKASVTPRETASLDNLPIFVNVAQNDLHLDPANNCNIDGTGAPIPSYTDDYDGDVRDATLPDPGMDEFDGSGSGFIWKGLDTDWMNAVNWCGGVPTVTSDVIIPAGRAFYPIITTGAPVARNITIASGGSITIDPAGVLSNKGTWTNNGVLTNNGLIVLNGTTNQIFPGGGTGTIPAMVSLTVNNPGGATINKPLTLIGTLKPKSGNITVSDIVTLHSDLSGTARVDTVQGTISYSGPGKFSVERYISSAVKVGWRFLAAPISGAQTINQSWQEGQLPGDSISTGYGMQIVGPGGLPMGFDLATTLPSVKKYDQPTNTWIGIPNTSVPISATDGYMSFVRGDRKANVFGDQSATTLRMAGPIKTGAVTVSTANANTNKYISVGNPYPSAIDFASPATVRTGLADVYYVWDPKIGSYGAYVTFAGPAYIPSPATGSYTTNRFIESGQAFFLYSSASVTPHSITINENSKVGSNVQVARIAGPSKQLTTRLYLVSGGNTSLYDGNRVDFDAANSNAIDDNDAPKMANFGESLGIQRDGKTISVERRAEIVNTDTIFYQLGQFRQQEYQLEFSSENLALSGLTAYLEDNYLNTRTEINLNTVSTVNFTVTADVNSKAPDRFRLVFKQEGTVPVSFTWIKANRQEKNIMVSWNVENELDIDHYEIERSSNGQNFGKMFIQSAHGNGSFSTRYSQLDTDPLTGDNFYRVKSVGIGGTVKYSDIVRVNMAGNPSIITIYPNPVKDDGVLKISMMSEPKGVYRFNLLNVKGQIITSRTVNHDGGNSVYDFELPKMIAHGNYLLQVIEGDKIKTVFKILY